MQCLRNWCPLVIEEQTVVLLRHLQTVKKEGRHRIQKSTNCWRDWRRSSRAAQMVSTSPTDSPHFCFTSTNTWSTAVCFSVALKKSKSDLDAMKKQTEGLTKEYDRLLQEHQELLVTLVWMSYYTRAYKIAVIIINSVNKSLSFKAEVLK